MDVGTASSERPTRGDVGDAASQQAIEPFTRASRFIAMGDEINIEFFIYEIKKYPEIWDLSDKDYQDKNKKQTAWNAVCEALYEGFSKKSTTDKNNILKKITSKWKNLKDNYGKSIRKRTKCGQSGTTGRQYIYAKQLSFLQLPSSSPLANQFTIDDETSSREHLDSPDEGETSATSFVAYPSYTPTSVCENPTESRKSIVKRRREEETSVLKFINIPITPETEDQDRSFFESLLPIVRKLDEDRKLEFRSEVLNVIKRIKHG